MEDLCDVYASPLPDSPYVKPFRLNYTQNGREKNWDLLEVHASVAVVIFNVTKRKLVLVKQFRPAVYYSSIPPEDKGEEYVDCQKYPASLGVTLELCAGIVDKPLPLNAIASEEVLEECGYKVEPHLLQQVMSYRSGVGCQGSMQTLFYVEVGECQKVEAAGGGVDDEIIEVVEMSIAEVEKLLAAPGPLAAPPSALFGLSWFLLNKADKWRKSFDRHCSICKEMILAGRGSSIVSSRI